MESIGRGRGWAQKHKDSLPKPGSPSRTEDFNHINLLTLINFSNNKNIEELTHDILTFIKEKVDKENLKNINDNLYKYALDHREFAMQLPVICCHDEIKNMHDSKHRSLPNYFINRCQIDYERRKELREENIDHFYNAIRIFSTYVSGHQKTILQFALIGYMETLLETHSPEDIKLFMEQFIQHGKQLHYMFQEKLNKLMIIIRQVLIKENISVTSRQMLLYTIDVQSRYFTPLPNSLEKFYKSELDKIVV